MHKQYCRRDDISDAMLQTHITNLLWVNPLPADKHDQWGR